MKHKTELDDIQEYIDNFDPQEFSSTADWKEHLPDEDEKIRHIDKFKARMQRKKQMENTFLQSMNSEEINDSDVTITQEQIDELLATM